MIRTPEVFRNRIVQAILLSLLFVRIWVRNFAVLLFVVEKTNGDPFAVSMISVAEFAPIFLFSFIGGTFADRWRPKRTMIWCEFLSALSIFAVLLSLMYGGWQAVFLATLVSAVLSQFSQPSGMKLFKIHVPEEQVQMGMSIYQTVAALFVILGPVLGTFVYQNFGIHVSIAIMGVSFIFSGLSLFLLPADPTPEERPRTSLREEMASGIRYVFSKRVLFLLAGSFVAAGLALGLIQPLNIFLVTERLELPKENLQWILTANGVGMILGGGVALGFSKKIPPQRLLMIGMMMSAVGIAISGLSKELWLTMIFQFVIGLVMPFIQIGINTMILQQTESAFIGRVNGILNLLFTGTMVLAMSASGALKQMLSIVGMFELAAILFVAGVLVILPLYRLERGASPLINKATDRA
jgi:MFS family permease